MGYWQSLGDSLLHNIVGFSNPSWQQLVLLFGLIAIFLFRKNISGLIDRARRISPSGIDFHRSQTPPPGTDEELGKIQNTFSNITSLPTIKQNLNIIKQHLLNQKITDPSKAQDYLVRELADVYFLLRCERIYWSIFGSQINLLKKIKTHPNGFSDEDLNQYFEEILKIYPEFFGQWNTTLYIQFLIQSNLITDNNGFYKITEFGIDFLTWLQRSGYPETRPL